MVIPKLTKEDARLAMRLLMERRMKNMPTQQVPIWVRIYWNKLTS